MSKTKLSIEEANKIAEAIIMCAQNSNFSPIIDVEVEVVNPIKKRGRPKNTLKSEETEAELDEILSYSEDYMSRSNKNWWSDDL